MKAAIRAIASYLPEAVLTNDAIAAAFPDWPADKIEKKLGVRERRISGAQNTPPIWRWPRPSGSSARRVWTVQP